MTGGAGRTKPPVRAHLRVSPYERFISKVKVPPTTDVDCWEWTGCITNAGYGQFRLSTTVRILSHRFAYEYHVGPIPAGLQLDHLCRNRACVSPHHLEPVTARENTARGLLARKGETDA